MCHWNPIKRKENKKAEVTLEQKMVRFLQKKKKKDIKA